MRCVCRMWAGMLGLGITSDPGITWLHVGITVSFGWQAPPSVTA